MDLDEIFPGEPKKSPQELANMSRDELADYIHQLEAEILRARDVLDGKEKHIDGAASLFKS
jgi:hypothetical protein